MRSNMKSVIKKLLESVMKQKTYFDGVLIPAKHIRLCGDAFKDDEYFLNSARNEADRLTNFLNLSKDSRVLDIGCGPGRLPIGILSRLGSIKLYQGIDVDKRSINWCNRYITRGNPNFNFLWIDVENTRYNPSGENFSEKFELPFEDHSFDIIYLYSVFSHMISTHIMIYLQEFKRLLSQEGKIFLTAFVEENVPNMNINPPGYRRKNWKGPLHCVRYNKDYFNSMLYEYGFVLDKFDYEVETQGQSAIYLSHK